MSLPVDPIRARPLVGSRAGAPVDAEPDGNDWYAKVFVIERRKCLLLVHSDTLFPALDLAVRVAQLNDLGLYVATIVVGDADVSP